MPFDEFGQIIHNTSGGSENRNTNPGRINQQNNFNGWWIVFALIFLFIGYEVISNLSSKKKSTAPESQTTTVTSPNNNNQYSPPPQETYTPPSTTDTSSISSGVENSSLSNGTDNSNPQPEKVYPYGEGFGKLTFYKTCNSCPDLEVSVDGDYLGTLTQTLNSSASCGDYGTISKILSVGNHTITGKDSYGTTYNGTAYVYESECTTDPFSKPNDVKPNPFGTGNGKLTFYKTCNSCPELQVSVDGEYVGTLSQTLSSSASCDDYGTLSKILSVGNHSITGQDSYGTTYKGTAYVYEGECRTNPFSKSNDVKPNPYGTGNGQITIYHNCSNCSNVQVSVDGYYSGTLSQYFSNGSPSCGSQNGGTVVKNLSTGSHTITAKDEYGNTWSGYVYVDESSCKTYALQNFTQGNPYGYGNGKVSFFTTSRYGHDIYVDGTFYGSLNQYFTGGSVTCGQSGTLSIILSQGGHSFSAKDNNGAWNGTFTIVAGQCSIIQVNRR